MGEVPEMPDMGDCGATGCMRHLIEGCFNCMEQMENEALRAEGEYHG